MTMNCPRCATELAGGSATCSHCGWPVAAPVGRPAVGQPAVGQAWNAEATGLSQAPVDLDESPSQWR
jgi:hypothetical protein